MTGSAEALKKNVIINAKDIEKIRQKIAVKMPNANENDKAKVLSRAIIRVIDMQISWLSEEHRLKIRRALLDYLIIEGKNELIQYDVYKICLDYSTKHYEIKDGLENWVKENTFDSPKNIFEYLNDILEKYQLKAAKAFMAVATGLLIVLIINNLLGVSLYQANDTLLDTSQFEWNEEVYYAKLFQMPSAKLQYKYQDYNYKLIKDYLRARNSMLLEGENLEIIIAKAKAYNIDPLILLAIIGQEQGFVPKDGKYAAKIINNPFNVYHSWMDYNTTLSQSTVIACNTINHVTSRLDYEEDYFYWLNQVYAEDEAWACGVRRIYNILDSLT